MHVGAMREGLLAQIRALSELSNGGAQPGLRFFTGRHPATVALPSSRFHRVELNLRSCR